MRNHGQFTVYCDTKVSNLLRWSNPGSRNKHRISRKALETSRGAQPYDFVLLGLRRSLFRAIQSLTASTQFENLEMTFDDCRWSWCSYICRSSAYPWTLNPCSSTNSKISEVYRRNNNGPSSGASTITQNTQLRMFFFSI